MITPNYGPNKQEQFRNRICPTIKLRHGTRFVSFGGALCLQSETYIEYRLIKRAIERNLKATFTIIEKDKDCIKKLLLALKLYQKHTKKKVTRQGNLYTITVNNCTINLWAGTAYSFFKSASYKITDMILDYYGTINKDVIKTINIIRAKKLLSKRGQMYLTSCEPRRAINTEACQKIIGYDTNGAKNYRSGMRQFLKARFKKENRKIDLFDYSNKDVSKHALTMHVARIR